jgi:hypothetical protein
MRRWFLPICVILIFRELPQYFRVKLVLTRSSPVLIIGIIRCYLHKTTRTVTRTTALFSPGRLSAATSVLPIYVIPNLPHHPPNLGRAGVSWPRALPLAAGSMVREQEWALAMPVGVHGYLSGIRLFNQRILVTRSISSMVWDIEHPSLSL